MRPHVKTGRPLFLTNDLSAADVFSNRTGEGCTSPQVSSLLSPIFRVLPTSAALYFCHSHCLKGHTSGPRLPFTVTASTNVWFVVSVEKWAEQIHGVFLLLFFGVALLSRAALFISALSLTVTSQIMCWLMALSPLACFPCLDRQNRCVPALLQDIREQRDTPGVRGDEWCLPSFYFLHNSSPSVVHNVISLPQCTCTNKGQKANKGNIITQVYTGLRRSSCYQAPAPPRPLLGIGTN